MAFHLTVDRRPEFHRPEPLEDQAQKVALVVVAVPDGDLCSRQTRRNRKMMPRSHGPWLGIEISGAPQLRGLDAELFGKPASPGGWKRTGCGKPDVLRKRGEFKMVLSGPPPVRFTTPCFQYDRRRTSVGIRLV